MRIIDELNEKWLATVEDSVEELSRTFEERAAESRKILATIQAWSDITLFRAGLLKLTPDAENQHRIVSERIREKCENIQRHAFQPLTEAELKAAIIELDISSEKKGRSVPSQNHRNELFRTT
jgi:hypothetical protein